MGELYEYIDTWDGKRVFTYVVVFIIILWFISRRELGINVLIAIMVGIFVINYLNNRSITSSDTLDKIQKIKKNTIIPPLSDNTKNQEDIVDFLFSIQDLYAYSPQQYIEMVKNLNYFYGLYENTFVDNKMSYLNYGMMKQFKCDALNTLSSIIYSLPEDKHIKDKINISAAILDDIMTKHLDHISYVTDNYIYKNGYNVDTKIIDYGPKAANEYGDMFKIYSYEVH
jgi:hypothetical protein